MSILRALQPDSPNYKKMSVGLLEGLLRVATAIMIPEQLSSSAQANRSRRTLTKDTIAEWTLWSSLSQSMEYSVVSRAGHLLQNRGENPHFNLH